MDTGLRHLRHWLATARMARVWMGLLLGSFLLAGVPRWEWHVHAADDVLAHADGRAMPQGQHLADAHGHAHAHEGRGAVVDQVIDRDAAGMPTLLAHVHACAALSATLPEGALPLLATPAPARWSAPQLAPAPIPQAITPEDRPPIG